MKKKLHKDDSGVAMIMALIVGVVVMVFCLSLLLVAYTLFAQTNRNTIELQCRLLAQSYVENLQTELKDADGDMVKYLQYKMTDTSSEYGIWASADMTPEEEEEYRKQGIKTYTELQLKVDAEGYHIYVTLTHEPQQGGAEDDDGPDDEYEGQESGEKDTGAVTEAAVTGKKSGSIIQKLNVRVRCVRGEDNGRGDSYSMETECEIPAP